MNRPRPALALAAFTAVALVSVSPSSAAEPAGGTTDRPADLSAGAVVFDMDSVRHQPTAAGPDKAPIGRVELVPGKFGSACRFEFNTDARGGFFTAAVRPDESWNRSAGLSFWVKGDGSSSWGGLEMIDNANYALRYGYCFAIDSTEWRKITIPWCDLIPELPAGAPVDSRTGYAPAGFGNLWFGKWYYWGEYPAQSYAIDQVAIEPRIDIDMTDTTPPLAGTPRTLLRLKAGEPVTIVTMGDSLSDKRHWANREVLWSELLVRQVTDRFHGQVRLVNPAIGGTQLTHNLVLMPRWLKDCPQPDLVTVWFGYNDWDGGMRRERFEQMLRLAVDRIRRMTRGKSEVLLMTTCPAFGRWDTMNELADAVRNVAAEKKTGLADVAAAFHAAGLDDQSRLALYCSDRTHLAPHGHRLVADTVARAVAP
ncbi:MAG: GDSL-type esterase/lipase family protein [Thermoguttaceae bacterium]